MSQLLSQHAASRVATSQRATGTWQAASIPRRPVGSRSATEVRSTVTGTRNYPRAQERRELRSRCSTAAMYSNHRTSAGLAELWRPAAIPTALSGDLASLSQKSVSYRVDGATWFAWNDSGGQSVQWYVTDGGRALPGRDPRGRHRTHAEEYASAACSIATSPNRQRSNACWRAAESSRQALRRLEPAIRPTLGCLYGQDVEA